MIAAGAFWFATRHDRPPDAARGRGVGAVPDPAAPATQPLAVLRGGDLSLAQGTRPYFRILEPHTGRVKYEFRTEKWEPVNDTLFKMERPDIRIHMPGGQIAYVTADGGDVEIAQVNRNDVEPRRGRLSGNVKVTVDRTSRKWREANPDRAALERHPEQLVHIWLWDEARFDLELSRLAADGAVRVQSEEADVQANAGHESLLIRWDQIDNRLESLALQYGGRMELRRGGGVVQFATLGAPRPIAKERAASDQPSRQRQPDASAGAVGKQGASQAGGNAANAAAAGEPAARPADVLAQLEEDPLGVLAPRKQQAPRIETFSARFDGKVRVEQIQGLRTIGGLDADTLELTFDVSPEQRRAVGAEMSGEDRQAAPPATRPAVDARAASEADGAVAAGPSRAAGDSAAAPRNFPPRDGSAPTGDSDEEQTRLVLTWTGPMQLSPIAGDPATQTGRRFDAVAVGEQVVVRDKQGQARCKRMEFHNETTAVRFTGDERTPAVVRTDDGREIEAPEIAFDRSVGQARLTGAGVLRDRGGSAGPPGVPAALRDDSAAPAPAAPREPVEIRWTRDVQIELARGERTWIDPDTGKLRTAEQEFLRQADFHGDVRMTQSDRKLAGDDAVVTFGQPSRGGALADHIERLDLTGNVLLAEGGQTITGRQLEVRFIVAADGRNAPDTAVATGAVRMKGPGQSFEAEHIRVRFNPARPADATTPIASTGAGRMRELEARGRVSARDEHDRLELESEQLDAAFDDAGALRSALLTAPDAGGLAIVRRDEYAVSGRRVEIDAESQRVSVPGRGHAAFVSTSDFDGRALRDPTAVNVTFSDGMWLDGSANAAVFRGDVRTSTETHELTCNRQLTLRLEDEAAINAARPAGVASAAPVGASGPSSRSNAPVPPPRDETPVAARVMRWMKGRFVAAPAESTAAASAGPRKRPVSIVADGDAAAVTTEYDDRGAVRNRMRISGPTLDVDLKKSLLVVRGRGSLAIEDYRAPSRGGMTSSAGGSAGRPGAVVTGAPSGGDALGFGGPEPGAPLLGRSASGGGPSQTVFFWANQMSFKADDGLANFDRGVQMVHRSGDKLVLQQDLAAAIGADVESLRLGAGREATLTCDNLLVQFITEKRPANASLDARERSRESPAPALARSMDIRWTRLKRLLATGNIYLQENTRSLMGQELNLDAAANTLTLRGPAGGSARLYEQDEASQRIRTFEGPLITWNRATGVIDAPGARVTSR